MDDLWHQLLCACEQSFDIGITDRQKHNGPHESAINVSRTCVLIPTWEREGETSKHIL